MEFLFENELLNKNNELININEILKNKSIIGIYFSAHYCPPCRKFTPILSKVYNEINKINNNLEIIFVASDKTEEDFIEYYKNMPWLALPYDKRYLKVNLCEKYNIKTVPALIFLNKDGYIINKEGRYLIQNNENDINFIINSLK
jgi:nucleoredoxin